MVSQLGVTVSELEFFVNELVARDGTEQENKTFNRCTDETLTYELAYNSKMETLTYELAYAEWKVMSQLDDAMEIEQVSKKCSILVVTLTTAPAERKDGQKGRNGWAAARRHGKSFL